MIKKNYSKFEVKEEFGTLSFNNVLLYREDTKMYQVIFNHYLAFISCLLEKPDLSVKTALKSIFRKSQVRSISEKFGLNLNAQIVCLSPSQWLNCFWKCWKLSLKISSFVVQSRVVVKMIFWFGVVFFKLPHNGWQIGDGADF